MWRTSLEGVPSTYRAAGRLVRVRQGRGQVQEEIQGAGSSVWHLLPNREKLKQSRGGLGERQSSPEGGIF